MESSYLGEGHMVKKSRAIYIGEQIKIFSTFRGYSLYTQGSLEVMTEDGAKISLKSKEDFEIVDSEDEYNYIEYEFSNNKVIDTVSDFLKLSARKLFLTRPVKESITVFDIDTNYLTTVNQIFGVNYENSNY
jgi:hypothetical protein